MEFRSITIKNFRNFKDINIKLGNKNVFFGMNDVGKTNFLYALRCVFDREVRKIDLIDTDFFQKNTDEPIEITVCIYIGEVGDPDSDKLRAKVKGAILSGQDEVYIKLVAQYNKTELIANPILYWGGEINDLREIKATSYTNELDKVFNVIYIDAYVDLNYLFKKNVNKLLKNDDDADKEIKNKIDETIKDLNQEISSLSGIKNFENEIKPEYNSFRNEKVDVTIKSEIAVNGIFSSVSPYIKNEGSDDTYPTSGEGRKKLLVYSIFDLLAKGEEERKINLFLIEEPENHLHRSLQLALSHRIFIDDKYKYTFLTTHSSYVLAEMDKVNLVRIYGNPKIDSYSTFYSVPDEYKNNRQRLNKSLSEAIFADKVLIVEGPSEEILFDRVLRVINPFYQTEGIYILQALGVGIKKYKDILEELKIKIYIKTDNDLRKANGNSKYSVIGFSRVNNLIGEKLLPVEQVDNNSVEDKRKLYNNSKAILDTIRSQNNVYLSKVSLEEDLDEVIHTEMTSLLSEANGDVVGFLQQSKQFNMDTLVKKLTDDDCMKVYNHYNFACLKDILK